MNTSERCRDKNGGRQSGEPGKQGAARTGHRWTCLEVQLVNVPGSSAPLRDLPAVVLPLRQPEACCPLGWQSPRGRSLGRKKGVPRGLTSGGGTPPSSAPRTWTSRSVLALRISAQLRLCLRSAPAGCVRTFGGCPTCCRGTCAVRREQARHRAVLIRQSAELVHQDRADARRSSLRRGRHGVVRREGREPIRAWELGNGKLSKVAAVVFLQILKIATV